MSEMNPFVKSLIVFVVLLVVLVLFQFVMSVAVWHQDFVLDLALVFGGAAGGAVIFLVHDLTKEE